MMTPVQNLQAKIPSAPIKTMKKINIMGIYTPKRLDFSEINYTPNVSHKYIIPNAPIKIINNSEFNYENIKPQKLF